MEYYFNELDPVKFQRLINSILVARLGENARLTPLRGPDGGRDGETAPANPYFEFRVKEDLKTINRKFEPPEKGRYLFQVKHHRTTDRRMTEVRQVVVSDFEHELTKNVLPRKGPERVNFFFLITNVPASAAAMGKIDELRKNYLSESHHSLHADVMWKEHVVAFLDQFPAVWSSFPELFAGRKVPILAQVANQMSDLVPRAVRTAIGRQYERDKKVKFRQIELEQDLSRLFVDLDASTHRLTQEEQENLALGAMNYHASSQREEDETEFHIRRRHYKRRLLVSQSISTLRLLVDDNLPTVADYIILEGGPGQGKSTITQMAAQIYRNQLLERHDLSPEGRWKSPQKIRLPFRIELREFAEWLGAEEDTSVEQYLAQTIRRDSGGCDIRPDNMHTIVENSPVLLIFDGLDEVGSDRLREQVLSEIKDCIGRFKKDLGVDLRAVVTARPPGLTGHRERLADFSRFSIKPMGHEKVDDYVSRWLSVQIADSNERDRIRNSFDRRRREPHVEVLAKNPMQLSVLLQFIRLKGEAFPDRRAELYRDYFQIVIDRDVEKSPELRENREVIEALHEFLGYKLHSLTEVNQADRTLERVRLLQMVRAWLTNRGDDPKMAGKFFRLGEERFGLIVAPKGEGKETRYGFEVQPVQEYFAAAYISNQIPPRNAHDVFQELVRRSYWREVALFLAGLRRRNEKADLVARTRELDRRKQSGWRQVGRSITLQLLQEGVFSEPPYVFSQALHFVLDALDPDRVPAQREPDNFLQALTHLMRQNGTDEHRTRLSKLIERNSESDDRYVLYRLYRVALRAFPASEAKTLVQTYQGNSLELKALVRLGWPLTSEIDISEMLRDSTFWNDVPTVIWARQLWALATHENSALELPLPAELHLPLFEQFAANPRPFAFYALRKKPPYELSSSRAICKLLHNLEVLSFTSAYPGDIDALQEELHEQLLPANQLQPSTDHAGLPRSIRDLADNLIVLSSDLVNSMSAGGSELMTSFELYVKALHQYMREPGLQGWIACRAATNLLQAVASVHLEHRSPRTWPSTLPLEQPSWLQFTQDLASFYLDSDQGREYRVEKLSDLYEVVFGREFHYRRYFAPTTDPIPRFVRLESDGEPVSITYLLSQLICFDKDLPFDWLYNISFTPNVIRPLVEKCRICLPRLLECLRELNISHVGPGKPLIVQDIQRILKIARRTENRQVLTGSLIALFNSSFLRLANPNLISKLMQVNASHAGFASRLFATSRDNYEADSNELETLRQVAEKICDSPMPYPYGIVCSAAGFLAEDKPPRLPAISTLEQDLGIQVMQ